MRKIDDISAVSAYLKQYNWDEMLSDQARKAIRIHEYDPGEFIIRGGLEMTHFILYVDGKAKVFKDLENGQTMLVRFYQPFQVMGDVELFLDCPCVSSVQALTRAVCLAIPMDVMREETGRNIPLLRHFCTALAWKLTTFNMTSAINQNYSLEARLAGYLAAVYLEGEGSVREELITENLGEMSEILGCSYRHLTRTLGDFKERGLIEKNRRTIRIIDAEGIMGLAGESYL